MDTLKNIYEGQKVSGIVKNIKPYGAFIKIENGPVGLAYIEDLSVARIKSPYERFEIGQKVDVMVKSIENAEKFSEGMKVKGIVRETEKNKNGVFIELTPNLVGMIEYKEGLNYGEPIDVCIKKIIPEKKKIKLTLI